MLVDYGERNQSNRRLCKTGHVFNGLSDERWR